MAKAKCFRCDFEQDKTERPSPFGRGEPPIFVTPSAWVRFSMLVCVDAGETPQRHEADFCPGCGPAIAEKIREAIRG